MTGIDGLFARSVTGWDTFRPTGDQRNDDRAMHGIMSAVSAVLPNPLAITGTVENDQPPSAAATPVAITAVGEHIAVHITGQKLEYEITVHPNSTLESIKVDAAPLVTSRVLDVRGKGPTLFTLQYNWGAVPITENDGDEEQRQKMLKHFAGLLAARTE